MFASLASESPGRLGEAAVVGSWDRGLRPGRGGSHWWVFLGRGWKVMSLESRALCVVGTPDLCLSDSRKKARATEQPFAMQMVSRREGEKKRKGIPESMVLYQSADC